ncbi:hypothetical protein CPC08DRAFT_816652 [Agrocybe pediades]|nr:hypothetical protein CPC08DRAFT_816652 [Agrocybe pediades]
MAPRPAGQYPTFSHLRKVAPRAVFVEKDVYDFPMASAEHVSRLHSLNARPFNHLGLWAYIAFGFVCLSMIAVFGYMVYTCYHSSKSVLAKKNLEAGNTEETKIDDDGILKIMTAAHTGIKGKNGIKVGNRISTVGEKVKTQARRTLLEMKSITGGPNRLGLTRSESERNIISASNGSQATISYTNESAYDLDSHYLSSPAIAHPTTCATSHLPFHLPPPPPSPTLAHKQHISRTRRGRAQSSPVSPSPSFFPAPVSPPVPPALIPGNVSPGNTSPKTLHPDAFSVAHKPEPINGDVKQNVEQAKTPEHKEVTHVVPTYDLHNIPFVQPLNPFMTPSTSTVMIWNDPKLSPVSGSIITSPHFPNFPTKNIKISPPVPSPTRAPASETSFMSGVINAALRRNETASSPKNKKLIKDLILPLKAARRHAGEAEQKPQQQNLNPFEQGC